jgi:hypothetical protein
LVQFLLFILLILCFVVIVRESMELHKEDKEYEKSIGSEEIKSYIEKTFGKGNFQIFRSLVDEEGKLRHIVYLSKYDWFKTPEYQWFDVYATNNGYKHSKIEE